jgi:hypothetical protein
MTAADTMVQTVRFGGQLSRSQRERKANCAAMGNPSAKQGGKTRIPRIFTHKGRLVEISEIRVSVWPWKTEGLPRREGADVMGSE